MKKLIFLPLILVFTGFSNGIYCQISNYSAIPSADSYVNSHDPGSNFGTEEQLFVQNSPGGGIRRSLLKFDLSELPQGIRIESAKIILTPNEPLSSGTFYDQRIEILESNWDENSVTFDNQPSSDPDGSNVSEGVNGKREFNVTQNVISIYNGVVNNEGWLVRMGREDEVEGNYYSSKESPESSERPVLEIEYYYPLSISSASISHASSEVATDGSITPSFANGNGNYTYEWLDGNNGVIIGSSSTLTGISKGWYGLHAYNNSGDEFYMAFIIGTKCSLSEINFKPNSEYVDNAMIFDLVKNGIDYGDYNYANYGLLKAESWTNGSWYDMKSLIKFNLWMDSEISVNLAELNIIGYDHNPLQRTNDSELSKILNSWNESEVTFNSAPSISTSEKVLISGTSSTTENKIVDISDFWNEWKTDNNLNYGLSFQLQSYADSYTKNVSGSPTSADTSIIPWIDFDIDLRYKSGCPDATGSWIDTIDFGKINVDLSLLNGEGLPYTYFLGDENSYELNDFYSYLIDSSQLDVDSSNFFLAKDNLMTKNLLVDAAGLYKVSVYNNLNEQIFTKNINVQPELVLAYGNNSTVSNNSIEITQNGGYAAINQYLSNGENLTYDIEVNGANGSNEYFIGFANDNSSAQHFNDLSVGVGISGSVVSIIDQEVVTTTSIIVSNSMNFRFEIDDGDLNIFKDNQVIYTKTMPEEYLINLAKGGSQGLKSIINVAGVASKKPYKINLGLTQLDCAGKEASIKFGINCVGSFHGSIVNYSIVNLSTGENVIQNGNIVANSGAAPIVYTYTNGQPIGAGVYQIQFNIAGQLPYYFEYFTIGYEQNWIYINNYDEPIPSTISVINQTVPNDARSENYLPSNTQGWISFKISNVDQGQNNFRLNGPNPNVVPGYLNLVQLTEFLNENFVTSAKVGTSNYLQFHSSGPSGYGNWHSFSPNSYVRLEFNSSNIDLFINEVLVDSYTGNFGMLIPRFNSLLQSEGFTDIVTSFGCAVVDKSFAQLKNNVNGGVVTVENGLLKFTFDEEYEQPVTYLDIKIFDKSQNIPISCSSSGVSQGTSPILYQPEDGRYEIDISSALTIGQFYTLELKTQNNKKLYLKFLYKN